MDERLLKFIDDITQDKWKLPTNPQKLDMQNDQDILSNIDYMTPSTKVCHSSSLQFRFVFYFSFRLPLNHISSAMKRWSRNSSNAAQKIKIPFVFLTSLILQWVLNTVFSLFSSHPLFILDRSEFDHYRKESTCSAVNAFKESKRYKSLFIPRFFVFSALPLST